MAKKALSCKVDGVISIRRLRRFIASLFITLVIFTCCSTIINIAIIFITRGELGTGHNLMNSTLQLKETEVSVDTNQKQETKGSKDQWESLVVDSRIFSVLRRLSSYASLVETRFHNRLVGLHFYVNQYGRMHRIIRKRLVSSQGIMRTNEEYLYRTRTPFECERSPINKHLDPIFEELKTYLDEHQIDLFCIVTLVKDYRLSFYNSDDDYEEDVGLKLIYSELSKLEIPYFDCFGELKKTCGNKEHWFYRTDHHWDIRSVFNMMPSLVNQLNLNFDFHFPDPVDLYQYKNFRSFMHQRFFLGSLGRNVGQYFVPPDDFTYYTPDFATSFRVNIVDRHYHKMCLDGDFMNTIFFDKKVTSNDVWESRYFVYFGDDSPECDIINNYATYGPRALIIKDSSSIPVVAFLSLIFNHIKLLDFRYRSTNDKPLLQIIDEFHPDIVIFIQHAGSYLISR